MRHVFFTYKFTRSFIIAGIPGIVIGFIILVTVKEPERSMKILPQTKLEEPNSVQSTPSIKEKFKQMLKLVRPSLLILCLASSIRNAGMKK